MRMHLQNESSNVDAAPLCVRTSPAVIDSGKRLRRRGPRSHLAFLRRSVAKSCRTLPGISLGESRDSIPVPCLNLPCEASNVSSNYLNAYWRIVILIYAIKAFLFIM